MQVQDRRAEALRPRPGSTLDKYRAALLGAGSIHVKRMARAEVLFALAERYGTQALAHRAGLVGRVLARIEEAA